MITQLDIAWGAGFVDAEGYITVERVRSSLFRERGRPTPKIGVCGLDHRGPRRFTEIFGGGFFVDKWKNCARSSLYSRQAASVAQKMLPYLSAKKPLAEIAGGWGHLFGIRRKMPDADIIYGREVEYEKARALNHGGRQSLPWSVPTERTPCDLDYAWAAGVVDGDGCFSFSQSRGVAKLLNARLAVSVTDIAIAQKLYWSFGGLLYETPAKSGRLAIHRWTVLGKKAMEVTSIIRPYLVAKPDQADLILQLKHDRDPNGGLPQALHVLKHGSAS